MLLILLACDESADVATAPRTGFDGGWVAEVVRERRGELAHR